MITLKKISFFSFCLVLFSCAQISAPTGGEQDITPPQIIKEKTSPANYSTNFNNTKIVLTFDEYFTITNPNQNVLITPILTNEPKFITKGKTLTIELNDTLKDNTTYTINFGESIKDYNAGNILKNFSYVFSTGDFIDSMQIKGKVNNALNDKPAEGILVMLYDTYDDSVVTKNKPNYLALTDKQGNYSIKYIKEGKYKVFALKDENRNYKFDLPNEQVGFIDTLITLDTNNKDSFITINLFEEDYKKQQLVEKKYEYPGKFSLVFNRPANNLEIRDSNNNELSFYQTEKSKNNDSIVFWDDKNQISATKLIITTDSLIDTITVYPFKKPKIDTLVKLVSIADKVDTKQPLKLTFSSPIKAIDTNEITLKKDSTITKLLSYNIDSLDKKNVYLFFDKKEKEQFYLTINPNFVTDIYGLHLNDTLIKSTAVNDNDFYGTLSLNLTNLDSSFSYLVQLKNKETLIKENLYNNKKLVYNNLPPGKYTIVVLLDENNNSKWDTGNYYSKKQPEKYISYPKTIDIRSNWELEESWDLTK